MDPWFVAAIAGFVGVAVGVLVTLYAIRWALKDMWTSE